MNNIVTAKKTCRGFYRTEPVYQYDYGQILQLEGFDLPTAWEMHFSNSQHGESTTQIGQDGEVIIPDIYLTTGSPVFCWLYLHDGESDGETEYMIEIPVRGRASITNHTPTPVQQDAITQAIAALDQAVEDTAAAVTAAETAQRNAEIAEGGAVAAEQAAVIAKGLAEDAQGAAETAQGKAEDAQTAAETAQRKAEEAQGKAETAESHAQGYASDASGYADAASGYVSDASGYADQASGYAQDASGYADTASGYADDASGYATAASGSADSAGAEALKAEGYARGTQDGSAVASESPYYHNNSKYFSEQASGSATSAGTSESNASASALKAEGYAVGKQNGSAVASGSPYYHNNAEYFKDQAADSATAAAASAEELSGAVEDIADLKSAIEALPESFQPDMSVGQLMSKNESTDAVPYLFRKTGGDVDAGTYEKDTIVGGTVAWNQLCQNGDFSDGTTGWTASTYVTTSVSNGKLTAVVTDYSNREYYVYHEIPEIPENHVVLISAKIKRTLEEVNIGNAANYNFRLSGNSATSLSTGTVAFDLNEEKVIATVGKTVDVSKYVVVAKNGCRPIGTTPIPIFETDNVQVFDLTKMFGSTIAERVLTMETATLGSGIAWLRSMGFFTKPYYAYNTGELMSVQTSGHKTVGYNQWDEQWEVGTISTQTGQKADGSTTIRSKNYNPCMPNTDYYGKIPTGNVIVFWYDSNKSFIKYQYLTNIIVTSPSNAAYFMCRIEDGYGTTYKNDICINLSDPVRNGTYEPYTAHSYPLDSDLVLRGIPKLDSNNQPYYDGDTYEADGTVTRKYGILTIDGTQDISYTKRTNTAVGFINSNNLNLNQLTNNTTTAKIFSAYPVYAPDYIYSNDVIGISENKNSTVAGFWVSVPIGSIDSKDDFVAYLASHPITVLYPLATATTESADPFPIYEHCDGYGTEEYIDSRTIPIPVGHSTIYPEDSRRKLDGLPWNFATLIAPTEATYKATQAYTSGQLLIVNNILYKATAIIANGATITPGTNVTATTLAEVIAAL